MLFKDQMDREVVLTAPPRRIVSLVPSQTELLADLSLEEEVVGITRFCTQPEHWYRHKTRVGGTKDFGIDRILALKPDLVIGNKEENDKERIEALSEKVPVWMSDVSDPDSALEMIREVGKLCKRKDKAFELAQNIQKAFEQITPFPPLKTAYFIWMDPLMVAARQTFIHSVLQHIGLNNIFNSRDRYPETSAAELADLQPELILLSDEPFPFREKHIKVFQEMCPNAIVKLADGSLFSWYGSRLLKAPPYFESLRESISL